LYVSIIPKPKKQAKKKHQDKANQDLNKITKLNFSQCGGTQKSKDQEKKVRGEKHSTKAYKKAGIKQMY